MVDPSLVIVSRGQPLPVQVMGGAGKAGSKMAIGESYIRYVYYYI